MMSTKSLNARVDTLERQAIPASVIVLKQECGESEEAAKARQDELISKSTNAAVVLIRTFSRIAA